MAGAAIEEMVTAGPALLRLHGHVAHLELNRPEAANGLDIEMLEGLHAALHRCIADARVRVVLMSGKGAHFCAGGDVQVFASKGADLPQYIDRKSTRLNSSHT